MHFASGWLEFFSIPQAMASALFFVCPESKDVGHAGLTLGEGCRFIEQNGVYVAYLLQTLGVFI